MPIMIEVDESRNPLTTGTYEPDRVPQGFKAPDRFGRMRPNPFSGAKIGGGYDAPQGTPTWEPSQGGPIREPTQYQSSGITNPNLGGAKVWQAGILENLRGKFDDYLRHWKPTPTPWQWLRDWEQSWGREEEPLGSLKGLGAMGQAQMSTPWQSAEGYGLPENIEKEYNKFQMRANELAGRKAEDEVFRSLTEQGLYPWNLNTRPITMDGRSVDEYGESLWNVRPENIEEMEPQLEVRSRYKSEYDKAIKKLLDKGMKIKDAIIELTPQWGSQPYKGFNYKMANRGGLMSLV
jgi:hypothetical protein